MGGFWWNTLDIFVVLYRIGNLSGLLRELRTATTMFTDSFEEVRRSNRERPYVKTAIFMQGFFLNAVFYKRFVEFFEASDIRLVCPLKLARNVVSYTQARGILSDAIKEVEDRFSDVPDLIGHSKGGTDISGVLGWHKEIQNVYLIAAPFRGASLNALTTFMKLIHHKPGYAVDYDVLRDKSILKKITTIVTPADRIVPSHEAMLPGARKKIVIDRHKDNESVWNSHTGLPYYARETLLDLMLQSQKAA